MTREQIEDALFDVLIPLLPEGVKLVWAKQSAPRPAKPYVTMDFLSFGRRVGQDELRQAANGCFEKHGLREFTLSVNAYGLESFDLLGEIQDGLALEKTIQRMSEVNFSSVAQSEIRDLSDLIEARYETRAQIDLMFYRTVSQPEEIEWFDRVQVNGEEVTGS